MRLTRVIVRSATFLRIQYRGKMGLVPDPLKRPPPAQPRHCLA